jgi:murein DD-endopeptidase MepM/ murein hydrolase activator NlpD
LSAPRSRVAALLLGAAVVLLAIAALRLGPPELPNPASRLRELKAPRLWRRSDTLARGQTLSALLVGAGLSSEDAAQALRAATMLDDRRIPAGMQVHVIGDSTTDGRPTEVVLTLSVDKSIHLRRDGDDWTAETEHTPWLTDTILVKGAVRSTLYEALDSAAGPLLPKGARAELAWALADVYEYRIDMSRDLQRGDQVRVLVERARAPNGATRIGTIFAAGLERGGSEVEAYRFDSDEAERPDYYDQKGRSLRAEFLRAPLQFRRISSVFGLRKHPILGEWRAHRGTDYAANAGTPVRSIGDGVVLFAGVRGGYGNGIDVRHTNGFVTRYGHLQGFAAGIRQGARVRMGSTIGYVGMTGLATAPHLHFEVLVGGLQRDPRTALRSVAGPPLVGGALRAFDAQRAYWGPLLARAAGVVRQGTPAR